MSGRVLTDTLTLGMPYDLLIAGDTVIVGDRLAQYAVYAFLAENGARLAAGGGHGAGPGEFDSPHGIFRRPGHRDEFWIFDSGLDRLTGFDLGAFTAGGGREAARDPIPLSGMIIGYPRWLDDSTVIALNAALNPTDQRFALFDATGRRIATVGGRVPGDDVMPAFVRQQAYRGEMVVHPDRPLYALACAYAGRIDIFRRDGTLSAHASVPDAFEPDVSPADDGINMVRGPDFRFGYISAAATRNHLYALFSGRRPAEEDDGRARFGDTVHVFDWTGALVRVLRLDTDALAVAVDSAETRLFTTRLRPYPQVLAYRLPDAPVTDPHD